MSCDHLLTNQISWYMHEVEQNIIYTMLLFEICFSEYVLYKYVPVWAHIWPIKTTHARLHSDSISKSFYIYAENVIFKILKILTKHLSGRTTGEYSNLLKNISSGNMGSWKQTIITYNNFQWKFAIVSCFIDRIHNYIYGDLKKSRDSLKILLKPFAGIWRMMLQHK